MHVQVIRKNEVVKKSKKKVIILWIYVIPFHLATLIGHLKRLLGELFCNDKLNTLLYMVAQIWCLIFMPIFSRKNTDTSVFFRY